MTSPSALRSAVLASYRGVLRAANLAFKGDEVAILESRRQIRRHFEESRGVSDEAQIRGLIGDAKETAEVLKHLVVQSQIDEKGNLSTFPAVHLIAARARARARRRRSDAGARVVPGRRVGGRRRAPRGSCPCRAELRGGSGRPPGCGPASLPGYAREEDTPRGRGGRTPGGHDAMPCVFACHRRRRPAPCAGTDWPRALPARRAARPAGALGEARVRGGCAGARGPGDAEAAPETEGAGGRGGRRLVVGAVRAAGLIWSVITGNLLELRLLHPVPVSEAANRRRRGAARRRARSLADAHNPSNSFSSFCGDAAGVGREHAAAVRRMRTRSIDRSSSLARSRDASRRCAGGVRAPRIA